MKHDSSILPRPGTLNGKRASLLEHAKALLAFMKKKVEEEADKEVTTHFSEGAHAPTTMIRAAVAKTSACEHGEVYIPVLGSHGWTVRALKHIKKKLITQKGT